MATFADNNPYNIEAPQKLFIQYSHDIDFDYFTGKFPDGTESDWDWEEQYIPMAHQINGREVGRHTFMRIKIGQPSVWTVPIAISNNVTNIETVVGEIQDDGVTFTFTIKLEFTDGSFVESDPITIRNGEDGTKIETAIIDGDGHLIMTYSDGTIIDAGQTRGTDGEGIPPIVFDDYILSSSGGVAVWISGIQALTLGIDVTAPIEYDFVTGTVSHNLDDGNRHIPTGGSGGALLSTDGAGNYTWEVLDPNLKAPDEYDAAGAGGLYPVLWKGRAVEEGDTFYMTSAGTLGTTVVNIGDLLISKTDTPAQVDANWFVIESNRDQATETILGVSKIATQGVTDTGTNDTDYITPLKLETFSKWADYSLTGHNHVAADITDFQSAVTNNAAVLLNTAKVTNVTTNLSFSRTATTLTVLSSDGTDAILPEANTTNAGILGSDKWDEIVANTAKVTYKIESTSTNSYASFEPDGTNEYMDVVANSLVVAQFGGTSHSKLTLDSGLIYGATTGLRFGDGDTGFHESIDDTLKLIIGGTELVTFSDATLEIISATAASTSLAIHNNSAGGDTFLILDTMDDATVLIKKAGSNRFGFGFNDGNDAFQIYNYETSNADFKMHSTTGYIEISSKITADVSQNYGTNTGYWFGDGNTGTYEIADNQFVLMAGGIEGQRISEGNGRISTVLSGTVVETITDASTTTSTATLTRVGENFLTTVSVGDIVLVYGGTTAADYGTYIVISVDLDTQITVDRNFTVSNTDVDFDVIADGVTIENATVDGIAILHANFVTVVDEVYGVGWDASLEVPTKNALYDKIETLALFTDIVATKLDDFATPDDNTDLNATVSQHGLLLKLGGGTTNFLRADGAWAAPSGATVVFEVLADVRIREAPATNQYDRDFVVGSPSVLDDANSDYDARFYFDKSKGAFAAGKLSNSTPIGDGAIMFGNSPQASATNSVAIGSSSEASGTQAHAYTNGGTASGEASLSLGSYNNFASGNRSVACGDEVLARSFKEQVFGSANTDYTPSSTSSWDATDRLFVIGNGSSSASRSDAVVILKNGNVGIGTASPAGLFDISRALSGTPSATGQYLSLSASTFTDDNTAASGTAAIMAFNSIAAPTLAATNVTVTTTEASTLYIAGAPIEGTNQTITNAYGLYVASGDSYFGGNVGIGDVPEFAVHLIRDASPRIVAEGVSDVEFIAITHNNSAGSDSDIELWRSRGTKSTPIIVEDNDSVGSIKVRGYNDGAETFGYSTITEIASEVDGSWTTAPGGRMVFRIREKDTAFQSEFDILKLLSNKSIVIPLGIVFGLGTETPTELLHLDSDSGSTDIGLEGGAGGAGIGWRIRNDQAANRFAISSVTGSFDTFAERFTILAGGNIGINTDSPNTILDIQGGQTVNITTVNAATYDLLITDYILNVTYTGTGAVTSLTIPTAQITEGRIIIIKDAEGNASVNNITIDTEGSETIDGAATNVISVDYGVVKLYSDGSNLFII